MRNYFYKLIGNSWWVSLSMVWSRIIVMKMGLEIVRWREWKKNKKKKALNKRIRLLIINLFKTTTRNWMSIKQIALFWSLFMHLITSILLPSKLFSLIFLHHSSNPSTIIILLTLIIISINPWNPSIILPFIDCSFYWSTPGTSWIYSSSSIVCRFSTQH